MIRLFEKNEVNFNHNKWVLTECTSVKITETIEGIFDLDLEHPIIDSKNLSQYLVRGNIIKAPVHGDRQDQLFRIRKRTINSKSKRVVIYAQCIARADMDKNFVPGVRVVAGQTRKQAIQTILSNCAESHNYFVGNLDTNTNTSINLGLEEATGNVINYLDIDAKSPLSGFLDDEKSIKKAYGGEIIYNNFEINFVDERGTDHSFDIRSGKNLEELEQVIDDMDTENFATALTMQSADGLYLPNQEIIYSPNVATLGKHYKKIVCDDVTCVNDTQEAINVVYAQLRERAQKAFDNGMDKLKPNNTINFIQLANTEEYKDYAILEKCEIGNNVNVKYDNIKMDGTKENILETTGRVIKIVYNPILNNGKGRIEEVEIGERKKKTIVDTLNTAANNVTTINDKTNTNKTNIKKKAKEAKDYTDSTKAGLTTFIGETETGIMLRVTAADNAIGTRIEMTERDINLRVKSTDYEEGISLLENKISLKVEKGTEFSTELELHSDAIIQTIHGATDNKMTLDSGGLHIERGGFDFEDDNGDHILTAFSGGGVQIGDYNWTQSETMNKVRFGENQLRSYFYLSNIVMDNELQMGGYSIITENTVYAGALEVDSGGTKNCAHKTEHFGTVLINAYETAEYYFGDIGEGTIVNGECIVPIDPVFSECVNTTVPYQVFLQAYKGNITSVERLQDKFIVKGTDNTNFAWEIKAKRIGFENTRLELSKRQ